MHYSSLGFIVASNPALPCWKMLFFLSKGRNARITNGKIETEKDIKESR
jgi:hypothetical protein